MESIDYSHCPEHCPRCNLCPHSNLRRQKLEALMRQVELERDRYEADGLVALLPPVSWHGLVIEAMDA